MKTIAVSLAASFVIATGAFAGQNTSADKIERELIRSGQLELVEQYTTFTESEKRKLLHNQNPWVRQATREWLWSLYD